MKFSLKLPDNQDHKTPIVKGKLPITMFNQPFTSSFTSAINSSSDLSFSLSTNFPSGPCFKLTYSPLAASPSAASTTGPFTLSLKSGLGLFGSPEDSPLVFSSQFSLSLSKPFVPTFSLLFKPQFGHFCLKKSTVSGVHDQFSVLHPNDGVQLDSGSGLNPKFGSGFAVDESMGWQELKLESSSSGQNHTNMFGLSTRQTLLRGTRMLSTSAVRNDLARMQVLGRLAADPEIKTTKNGKDYVRYTVATSDPPTGPVEEGERPETTTSYHRFYVFGDRGVDRMKNIKKGYRVLVDAEFRIERTPAEADQPARDTLLALHRGIQVISKPREATESA